MGAKKIVVSKEVLEKSHEQIKKKGGGILKEFVAFVNRGSVVDLAVGVIIGGAFSAIVTAVVNIFLSLCTWAVPGGLTGLVTVLPAANPGQQGVSGIGQSFTDITDATIKFAAAQGVTITKDSATFMERSRLLSAPGSNEEGPTYSIDHVNLVSTQTAMEQKKMTVAALSMKDQVFSPTSRKVYLGFGNL